MKHDRRFILFALAAFLLLSCIGCSRVPGFMENKELRGYTEAMLNAMIDNDYDAGYALVADVCTEAEFHSLFTETCELFGDADTYELMLLNISQNRSFNNGETVRSAQASYRMTVGSERYIITVAMHSSYEKLASFYINDYEKTDYYRTGELGTMEGANAFQWAILLSNAVSVALIAFTLVDACRRKIKLKPLWIVLILLGLVSVGMTLGAGQFRFNFNMGWLFSYSALILCGGGTTVFRVMLPVGAIVYLILRNRLEQTTTG